MNKVEIYNSDYTKLNHSYIQIYETYQKLLEAEDADEEIKMVLESILMVMNPALDKIKSEMTVKTKYKEEKTQAETKAEKETAVETTENGGKIFYPKFN